MAQLAFTGLGVVDTLMSGRVGTQDLAAIGLGTSILMPIFMLSTGILLAMTPLIAKAFGHHDGLKISHILHQGVWLAMPLGLVSMLILMNLEDGLNYLHLEPKVHQLTADYLFYIAFGLPAIAVFQALRFFWEGIGLTLPTMIISFFALFLNVPLNAIFIYGLGPIDAYGASGCGIASGIVMWAMLFMGGVFVAKSANTKRLARYKHSLVLFKMAMKHRWSSSRAILKLGVPNTFALLFEIGLFSFIALFIAHLGAVTIAAHQVAISLTSILFMVPLSLAMAVTVRVGQSYGHGNFQDLKETIRAAMVLSVIFGILVSVITYWFKEPIANLYSEDKQVVALAVTLIALAVSYQVFDAIQAVTAGALRGLHSTKVTMYVTFFSFWGVGLGGGYLLAFTWVLGEPRGVIGFWMAIIMGLFISAILLQITLRYKLKTIEQEMNPMKAKG